jgi:sialate O-acetylesterase
MNPNTPSLLNAKKALSLIARFLLLSAGLLSYGTAAEPIPELPLLHPLFSDHMVLQRDVKVPIWGWASPGTKITVAFGRQTKTAVAGPDGKWMVHLSRMAVSSEPRVITVTSSEKNQTISIQDVLVGDVWLCSGQSNMEMGIGACNATNDIAQANFPQIRLLTVPRLIATTPVHLGRVFGGWILFWTRA